MKMKRKSIHPRKKQKIFERDNFKCSNCKVNGDFNSLEVDHIIPIINGGTNEESNLQTLCYRCNMQKLHGKEVKSSYFLDKSPLEKLEIIKSRLEQYKNLTYPEFKVVFTQDKLFKRLRIDLTYIGDLFFEISGLNKLDLRNNLKNLKQRDALINIFRKEYGLKYRDIASLLSKYGISITYQQIEKICSKFSGFSKENA